MTANEQKTDKRDKTTIKKMTGKKRVIAQRLKRVQEFTTICKTCTKKLTNKTKFI